MLQKIIFLIAVFGWTAAPKTQHIMNEPTCVIAIPDTSLSGINLRDAKSTTSILGSKAKLSGDSTHSFYSKSKTQVMNLTVHAGDGDNVVSIFEIHWAKHEPQSCRHSNIPIFKTEKGIELGVSKEYLIKKLGNCSSSFIRQNTEILTYRIESPHDSKNKLLYRLNMPIYYAQYYLRDKLLVKFEFGFEYP